MWHLRHGSVLHSLSNIWIVHSTFKNQQLNLKSTEALTAPKNQLIAFFKIFATESMSET